MSNVVRGIEPTDALAKFTHVYYKLCLGFCKEPFPKTKNAFS